MKVFVVLALVIFCFALAASKCVKPTLGGPCAVRPDLVDEEKCAAHKLIHAVKLTKYKKCVRKQEAAEALSDALAGLFAETNEEAEEEEEEISCEKCVSNSCQTAKCLNFCARARCAIPEVHCKRCTTNTCQTEKCMLFCAVARCKRD